MKRLLAALLAVGVSGCGSEASLDGLISDGRHRRTWLESQLAGTPVAIDHDDTVILQLEDGPVLVGDTGTPGTDVVTYEFTHPVNQTVCLEFHETIPYTLSIVDGAGNVVTQVESGDCRTLTVDGGRYDFVLTTNAPASRSPGTSLSAFIRPYAETTHCDTWTCAAQQPTLQGQVGTTTSHCTSNPYMPCLIPDRYSDLPFNCTLRGPWLFSDLGECLGSLPDQDANCRNFLYRNCDQVEAMCNAYWANDTDDFESWGDTGQTIWEDCFLGSRIQFTQSQYGALARSVISAAQARYIGQYCADVAQDCASIWTMESAPPSGCAGFVRFARFGELSLQKGQVAIYPRTYQHVGRNAFAPATDDVLMVVDGRCDNVPHRVGIYMLGPQTQAVVYPHTGLKGQPLLLENTQASGTKTFASPGGARKQIGTQHPTWIGLLPASQSSVTVNVATGQDSDACRLRDAGLSCSAATNWDVPPKQTGDVTLVGFPDPAITAGSDCAAAYLLDYRCDDLGRLGLANINPGTTTPQALSAAVVFDASTVLRSFVFPGFSGAASVSRGTSATPTTIALDQVAAQSAHAYKLPGYNHTILVSLRKCCGCDLRGVAFQGDDLSDTVLVGSDLSGAAFTNVDLVGADLRRATLTGATFHNVRLGNNRLGLVHMAGASMQDAANRSASTATLVGEFDWTASGTANGVTVRCGEAEVADLSGALFPIQMLPRTTWNDIRLQNATLLDKADDYDLSRINLAGGDYSGLKAGGKAMNMRGADLSGATLTGADFSSIDFGPVVQDGVATYTNLTGARLGGANFAYANLEGADFRSVTIDAASKNLDLSYAMLVNATFQNVDLGAASFAYAYLFSKPRPDVTVQKEALVEGFTAKNAVFNNCFLSNMTLTRFTAPHGNFSGAMLVGTQVTSGDLSNTTFSGAYLQGADLSGASLLEASLSGAYLSTTSGYWHYSSDDAECSDIRVNFEATRLPDTTGVTCPNGTTGPCSGDQLLPHDKETREPQSVYLDEEIFGNTTCITHEWLEKGRIPDCNDDNPDVMQCGCLVSGPQGTGLPGSFRQ